MDQQRGFFGSLFDLSFSEFITTKIIKFLFVLCIVGAVVLYFVVLGQGFDKGFWSGILHMFILGPIAAFIALLIARIYLEIIIVLFKISENTGDLVKHVEEKGEVKATATD